MTEDHKAIKELFEYLQDAPEGFGYGFHRTDSCLVDGDDAQGVLYCKVGYRIELTKTQYVDPTEEGFKWEDFGLDPDDFDENGCQFTFESAVEEDGFIDADIDDIKKVVGR